MFDSLGEWLFRANASYGHMNVALDQIDQLVSEVEALDAEENRHYGKARGDELPEELCDPEQRAASDGPVLARGLRESSQELKSEKEPHERD